MVRVRGLEPVAEVARQWHRLRRWRPEGPDDHVASLQAWLDRLVRRLRRGPPPPAEGRRFLIVQIDGLSRSMLERALGYLEQDFPWKLGEVREAAERGGLRVVSAGPNAFVYFVESPTLTLDEIDRRYPGLVDDLSRHRGVGFVLVRSEAGAVCVWQGKRARLGGREPGPFAGREDLAIVIDGIGDLMAMPSAGDLVIYGHHAEGGDVSFIDEQGAHAGPSREELHTFIIHPARVRLPLPIVHPVQLHPHFAEYLTQRRS